MPTILKIISHELISKEYLRLHVVSGGQPCGTIDLISEKINFNIVGKYFFKGMEAIKNIKLEYKEEKLILTFRSRKTLEFHCVTEVLEAVSANVGIYKINIKYS